MRTMRLAYLALVCCSSVVAQAQGDPETINRIINEGKHHNQVMKRLDHLTHEIGPRVTSSPQLAKAQQWAMSEFRKYGCTNVHLEKWGDAPVGFERGPRQIGRMVEPFESPIGFTTMNWTNGTNGLVRGEAIACPTTLAEVEKMQSKLKGAWVIMPSGATMRGPGLVQEDDLKRAIDRAGIAGRIFGFRDERLYSHGNWRDKTYEKHSKDVSVCVRKSDFDRISRNLSFGRKTVLEFDIENRWIKGPVPLYNVVADIKGSEKPDEMVIVCGHLDSWNSPGSQGACDNGTGSVVTIEAARILAAAKAKPKRTIRFILWSGEEQGLLGSQGYVKQHTEDYKGISAVLNDDGGTNYQGGYEGIASQKAMMEAAFAPTVKAFPDMPQVFRTTSRMPAGGSSDHAPFNMVGVPGFFTIETGRADYGFVWHTQNDRYEYAIPEYLVQSSTNHAVVSYNLACADTLLPREVKGEVKAASVQSKPVGADRVYQNPEDADSHDHDDDYVLFRLDAAKRALSFLLSAGL